MTYIFDRDKRTFRSAIFFLPVFVSLFLGGCKKEESDLGLDVQPDEDLLHSFAVDTFTIQTYTVEEDSLRTSKLSSVLLGNHNQPEFGQFNASFYTQLGISSASPSFDMPNTIVDSVVVQLVYSGSYGKHAEQQFEVYQLTDTMNALTTYYSNSTKPYSSNCLAPPLVNYTKPNPNDSVTVGSSKIKPHLRIHLSPTFGVDLLNASGAGYMTDSETFIEYFKGLYFKSSTTFSGTNGAVYNFNLTDAQSKLIVYYHDLNDTTQYDYTFGSSIAYFTHYETDHSGTAVEAQLADSTLGSSFYYLQAGNQLAANVFIPHIKNLSVGQSIVVNKAELVLPVQFYTIDEFSPSFRIFIFPYNADGDDTLATDQILDPSLATYGGLYNDSKKAYTFNLTRQVQRIMQGKVGNYGFRLGVGGSSVTATNTILSGPNSPNRAKPYLKITYTKYQ